MKKGFVFAALLAGGVMMKAQVTPPVPPAPPAPAAPSIRVEEERVTIVDEKGNTYVIDEFGVRKNGAMIAGNSEYISDEIDDIRDEIEEMESDLGEYPADSEEYQDLIEEIADLEEELADIEDTYTYTYNYGVDDTLPDSTTVTVGPWRLTVKEDNEGGEDVSIARIDGGVEDIEEVDDHYVDKFDTKWFLFDLGYNTYLNADYKVDVPEEYNALEDQQTWGSWDVNLHIFRQRLNMAKGYLNLNWGLSFEWHNYRYNGDFKILPKMDSLALQFESSEGVPYDYKKNRFSTTHFTLPVILGFETKPWDTDHSFRMGFGYSPGLMVKGKTKTKDDEGVQKVKDDFNLAPFRHEVNYIIGFGDLNIYASYDVNSMFREGQGPELHPFSVGLVLRKGF